MRTDLKYLQLAAAGQAKPLQAQEVLKSQDGSACLVEGNALPIQGARGSPWEFGADPDNAACRGGVCRASTAAGDSHKLGSSGRRLMDL